MPRLKTYLTIVLALIAGLSYGHLPDSASKPSYEFVRNQGQWHPAVRYRSNIPNGRFFLLSDGFTYDLVNPEAYHSAQEFSHDHPLSQDGPKVPRHAVKFQFRNMWLAPRMVESGHKPYYFNYFLSDDPSRWASNIHPCEKVSYSEVLPGVDLEVSGHQDIKYQWVIKDGDISKLKFIALDIEGADSTAIINGQLHVFTSVGVLIEDRPQVYQMIDGVKVIIKSSYTLENNTLGYAFHSEVQHGYPIVIDPKLIFSTYSGAVGDNFGYTATYDSKGNLYAGGIVKSGGYPVTTGAYDTTFNGGFGNNGRPPVNLPCDIAISKYDSAGTQLLWATYLGGSDDEYPHSLVVDRNDDLIMLGTSHSNNFPHSKNAFDSTYNGSFDIVVSKLSADGSSLMASTFIGGSRDDGLVSASSSLLHNYADNFRGDVIPDDDGNIYIASSTNSTGLNTVLAHKTQLDGTQDAFVFALNPSMTQMLWGSYLGGDLIDAGYSIKMDVNNIYIAGGTNSDNMPSLDTSYQPDYGGATDGYIAVFGRSDKQLKTMSYFGTSSYDQIYFIDLDHKGNVYATGQTEGSISKSPGVYGSDNKGQFIFKMDTALNAIEWQTTFGNQNNRINLAPSAFLVDVCEHIYFSGWGSNISNFLPHPGSTVGMETTPDAEQSVTDNNDFYILVLDKDASSLLYGTYFGGDSTADHVDGGTSRFDKRGVIYQSVCSSCPGFGSIATATEQINDFPVTPGAAFTFNSSERCSNASFKIDLQIKTAVVADFVANPTIGCTPLDVQFTNRSILGDSLFWDFGDGNTSDEVNPLHLYEEPGVYTVTLTVIDSNTCNISDVYQRRVTVIRQGKAEFKVDHTVCTDEFSIEDLSEDAATYRWDFGDGDSSTSATPEHDYKNEGTYTIQLIINEETLCADTAEQTVFIRKLGDRDFTLYNVFTPNDDGKNDCFHFDGLEAFCEGIEWKVYNRWGELMFETTDPSACWNGKLEDGRDLPESVYFYVLDLNPDSNASENLISGTITLLR